MRIIKLFAFFILLVVAVSQDDPSWFISIDCGLQPNTSYVDDKTGISYVSDVGFVDSGEIKMVSAVYNRTTLVDQRFRTLRSFPQGTRNCYTVKPPQGEGNRYLIKASFFHGDYDGLGLFTKYQFDLHLGHELWETVEGYADAESSLDIVHTLSADSVEVCLVKTGESIPFISVFESRLLENTWNSQSPSLRFDDASNISYISRRLLSYQNDYSPHQPNPTQDDSISAFAIIGPLLGLGFISLMVWLLILRYRSSQEEVTNVPVEESINKYVKEEVAPVVPVESVTTISSQVFIAQAKNQKYTYTELITITDNFRKVLGEGGFGIVYHGYIGETEVAVKLLSRSSQQGSKEFQAEANLLATIQHKNLTALVGYCYEGLNMGIIYEYMANGTLEKYLFATGHVLSWEKRLQIAIDAAQGLEYLHHQCKPPIVHRDIKATNILLDDKLQAKLSDFGLSRAFPVGGATHVATAVAGTFGYLDPESYSTGRITAKSDIYSFGVVLLQLITGRPALPKVDSDQQPLVFWVSSELETGAIANVVDTRLQVGDFSVNSGWKYLELAMACVSHNSNRRPPMTYVAMELQGCLEMHNYLALCENVDSSNTRVPVVSHSKTSIPMSATSITSLSQLGTQLWPPRAR